MRQEEAALENLDINLPDIFIWRELAVAGLILMDLSWGVIWVDIFSSLQTGVTLIDLYLVLGAAMIGAHLLTRAMVIFKLKVLVQRVTFVAFFLLVTIYSFRTLLGTGEEAGAAEFLSQPVASFSDLESLLPPEFVIIVTVLYFGYRGIRLAQEFIGPIKVFSHFRLGFIMFLLYIVAVSTLTGISPGPTWIIFLAASLLALACSRVALLALVRGGRKNPFNREWFIGLALAIGGALLLSGGIAVLASGIGGIIVRVAVNLTIAVIFLLLYPLVYGITIVVTWFFSLIQLEDGGVALSLAWMEDLAEMFQSLSESAADNAWVLDSLVDLWSRWGPILKLLVCSTVIFLVGLVVILRIREINRRRLVTVLDEDDLERSTEGLFRQLAQALRDSFGNRIGGRQRSKFKRNLAAARVRQIYAELGDISSELGKPRRASQTPHEFQPILNSLFVSLETEITLITEAYIKVRYGELPEDQNELAEIEMAWDKVEEFGKRRLKAVGNV